MLLGKYFSRLRRLLALRSDRKEPVRHSQLPAMEQLEDRTVPSATQYLLDFGTATSKVEAGYTRVAPNAYDANTGFGWQTVNGITAFDSGSGSSLTRDVHRGAS